MSAFILKIIACVTMALDHVGYTLTSVPELRMIGRIAFPIFAYMIAFGYRKTSDPYKYMLRVIVTGVISEYFFDIYFFGRITGNHNNVMLTLALGLLAITFTDNLRGKLKGAASVLAFLPAVMIAYSADVLNSDYGTLGVLLVILYYFFGGKYAVMENEPENTPRNRMIRALLITIITVGFGFRYYIIYAAESVVFSICSALPFLPAVIRSAPAFPTGNHAIQAWASLAVVFILLYNGKRGVEIKNKVWRKVYQYSFYAFYPVHIFVLYLIFR